MKWFDVKKGFGFITPEAGGPDVFVHQSEVHSPGFRSLADGEEVPYISCHAESAHRVTVMSRSSSSWSRKMMDDLGQQMSPGQKEITFVVPLLPSFPTWTCNGCSGAM